jgi:hypothetical protein
MKGLRTAWEPKCHLLAHGLWLRLVGRRRPTLAFGTRQQNQRADVPDVLIAPQPRLRVLSSQQPASSFSAFPFPFASICPTASSRGAAGRAPLLFASSHPSGAPPRPRRRSHSRLLQPPLCPSLRVDLPISASTPVKISQGGGAQQGGPRAHGA